MKLKTMISVVLLLFVAVSIVALIVKQSGNSKAVETASAPGMDTLLPGDRLIVYYFHGNVRCQTCNTLEAYSKEAVETNFSNDLESGRVEFQVVNYDETWNEHFLTDYDLSFQSLVFVEMKDGKEVWFANLEKIWDLVGDKPAYLEYVREGINSKLEVL